MSLLVYLFSYCHPVAAYEYLPDSEVATITSVSEKTIRSGSPSEEEPHEIEKDTDSDTSEAGSSPFFVNRLEETIEVIEGSTVRYGQYSTRFFHFHLVGHFVLHLLILYWL